MLKVFTVYDSKAEAYLQPFFAQATGAGLRVFIEAASNSEHQFGKHAADYTLFEIGTWDEQLGVLFSEHAHINLGTALQLSEPLSRDTVNIPTGKTYGQVEDEYNKRPVIRGGE